MAILPHSGLTVQIVVDGQPLPEYDDEDPGQDPTLVTKYIEAQAGSEFRISHSYDENFRPKQDIRASCYIDGTLVRRKVVCVAKHVQDKIHVIEGTIRIDGQLCVLQRFCFNNLAICKNVFSRCKAHRLLIAP
jgi:hypothetical protein